jgi:hypothetical protein
MVMMLMNVTGGIAPGQMLMYASASRTGKSTLNSLIKSLYYSNLCNEIVLPMKPAPKYKFSRANWYVAEYDWVYQAEVLEWCKQQFGPHPQHPDAWSRWYNKYSEKIHFRDSKDYEWFILRWS